LIIEAGRMRTLGLATALLMLPPSLGAALADEAAIRQSVVKISSSKQLPDFLHPWTRHDPKDVSGTGVVIDGRRILTNAHVVEYASTIFVQPHLSAERLAATVEAIAPGIDLAVLKLDDPTFFDAHPPMPRSAELPEVKQGVLVYGFPVGGQTLSITKGIVSRIEFTEYYYSTEGLRVQVDAAINPGNSGGPALVDDRMVGIIFSRLDEADNIGYIIPNEEIDLFLADVADGRYDGKPRLRDELQTIRNPSLRARLKLPKDASGVLVPQPDRDDASYPLKPWDVITAIGGHPVDDSGMTKVRDDLRVFCRYLIQKTARDGKVRLGLIRDGHRLEVDLAVTAQEDRLLRYRQTGYPPYFILGPLVFSVATDDFIDLFGAEDSAHRWYPHFAWRRSPLLLRSRDRPRFEGEELVVVAAEMFPHRVAKGYDDPYTQVVAKVNDVPIRNLRHFVETVRDATGDHLTITFAEKGVAVLVLDRKALLAATEDVLTENGIRRPCSDDLRPVWEAKAKAEPPAEGGRQPGK
jgi:S1-C subfamily serine protease